MQKSIFIIIIIILVAVLALYTSTGGASIKLRNDSAYDISPGLLVVHADIFSLNQIGQIAPPEYEPLAELGAPGALKESLATQDGVYKVIDVGHLKPGSETKVSVGSLGEEMADARVSYMAKIVQTNDGVVWLNSMPLSDLIYQGTDTESDGVSTYWAEIIDMGTEENSPIGSGFPGGQPDPSRGEENVDNGVTSGELVDHHNQFYGDPNISAYVLGFIRFDGE